LQTSENHPSGYVVKYLLVPALRSSETLFITLILRYLKGFLMISTKNEANAFKGPPNHKHSQVLNAMSLARNRHLKQWSTIRLMLCLFSLLSKGIKKLAFSLSIISPFVFFANP
jgi:hypothetical protein